MRSLRVINDPKMSAEPLKRNTTTAWRWRSAYWPVTIVAILASFGLTKNIDFGVYWHAVRGFNNQSQPLYGPASGIGYPMIFRYPPIAYVLLWPLGSLPLRWAGSIWILGAWALAVASLQTTARVLRLQFRPAPVLLSFAGMLAYCVLSVHSGNIQPYLIAMIFTALTIANTRPAFAAALLAISISFKIWPIFFLPCLLRRGRRAVLIWLFPGVLILWLIPLVVWSPHQYLHLIAQWYHEELQIGSTPSELWYFPGQSLRGILLRYTTSADPWLRGFPDVHFVDLFNSSRRAHLVRYGQLHLPRRLCRDVAIRRLDTVGVGWSVLCVVLCPRAVLPKEQHDLAGPCGRGWSRALFGDDCCSSCRRCLVRPAAICACMCSLVLLRGHAVSTGAPFTAGTRCRFLREPTTVGRIGCVDRGYDGLAIDVLTSAKADRRRLEIILFASRFAVPALNALNQRAQKEKRNRISADREPPA